MGDDRYGRTPRPGGRAPWERYSEEDDAQPRASRRSRHTDDPDPGSAPISVQDLVERVDSERKSRRRRRKDDDEAAPQHPADSTGARRTANPQTTGRRALPPETAAPNGSQRGAAAGPEATGSHRTARPNPQGGTGAHAVAPNTPGGTGSQRAVNTPAGTRAPRSVPPKTPNAAIDGLRRVATPANTGARRAVPGGRIDPTADPVTEELPAITEPPRGGRKKSQATAPVESPADYPTTALPAAVGPKPLTSGQRRRNRRLRLAGRSAGAMLAVIAMLITGGGWSYLHAKDNGFTQVSALDDNSPDVVDADAQYGDENFLIVGTDTRAGANSQLGAGDTADAEGARSDTVMLVNIPANRQRVVAVSFPRDLDVTRPVCEGWDNDKGVYTGESFPSAIGDKLNAVYALGGPKCLTKVIQKMSGLKINHFVGIDFAGFETMVDTIGGVEVCTTKPLVDEILGTVLTTPGKQIVNGSTALDYVRARHVIGEERSDYDRINRQQRFLSSLLRGALSSKVLFDPGKMNGFINAFAQHSFMDNVTTKDLLMLGRSMQKMQAGSITFLTVPTAGTTSYGNEIPRESDIKAIFRAVIDDQPLPGEKKSDPATTTTDAPPAKPKLTAVDPSTLSLQVSNGSGISGVAATAATKLANQGFQIYNTGNYADGTVAKTTVRYSSGHEAAAATVASALPGAVLEPASGLGSIVEVVLGTDYAGSVHAPVAFGQPLPDTPTDSGGASAAPVTLPSDLEHVNAADDTCK
ncbi:LCP family protein [Nocardia sp. SYP-A9097]|uniref:LCP family protein n=1 Tax=Nocardia sp. SYP-A9097 TaxID=2663237 RepID=UPI002814A191|nr:LCP family protein [Nocardia sp. SYP-A9097]